RRSVEAKISHTLPAGQLAAPTDWTPVFIVGLPRSGTTLLADRLARHPDVCQRGELPWLPAVAEQVINGNGEYRERLQHAAATYTAQLLQDDSSARWMLDKQPHNFMHVDLILARYPNAIRIVQYEHLVSDPASLLRSVADWLGLPPHDLVSSNTDNGSIISTASLWQARQPINTRSLRRWEHYSAYVPELLQLPDY